MEAAPPPWRSRHDRTSRPRPQPLGRALVPGGRLLVAYGPGPRPDRRQTLLETVRAAAAAHGFPDAGVLTGDGGTGVLAHRSTEESP